MYEDDDVEFLEREDKLANEKLERDGGVFLEPQRGEVDCNSQDESCAPDDYPEDPFAVDNRPGTRDDIGYSYGLASTDANDITFIPKGRVREHGRRAPATERDLEPGELDERDLWHHSEALIDEDERDGLKLPLGMDESEGSRVLDAMGDETGDAVPDGIEGGSATGEATTPDRGGFPERDA